MSTSVGTEKLIVDGKRLDGRLASDLRPIKMEVGPLKKANGSAMVEWGKNKVIAGVFGPREVLPKHMTNPHRAIIKARYAMAPFCSLEEHGRMGPNRRAQEIGKVTKHVFENAVLVNQFPKTMINVTMEVLQSDGGTRVSAITAAALAMADAGIPMRGIPCGVAVGKIDGEMVADLDKAEDNKGQSDMPLVVLPNTGEILLFQMDGMLTRDEISRGIDIAFEAAEKVRAKQVEALKTKYEKVELEIAGENGGQPAVQSGE